MAENGLVEEAQKLEEQIEGTVAYKTKQLEQYKNTLSIIPGASLVEGMQQVEGGNYILSAGFLVLSAIELSPSGGGQSSKSLFTYTKSAGKHFFDIIKRGAHKGQKARPYMSSPLLIEQIISTGKGVSDKYVKGATTYKVSGSFRGSNGTWELVVDNAKKIIYHFNFVK